MLAVTSITYFVADVKCGLYEINKNNWANVQSKKCSETTPKRCWTGNVQNQDPKMYWQVLYWH